jgi:small subunit ribosomal protein S4
MGLALTRREARQLVSHGHFSVNGKKVDIASYRVKVGDVVALRPNSRKSPKFKEIIEQTKVRVIPMFLDYNAEALSATITRAPAVTDLDYAVSAHLIVELYSK